MSSAIKEVKRTVSKIGTEVWRPVKQVTDTAEALYKGLTGETAADALAAATAAQDIDENVISDEDQAEVSEDAALTAKKKKKETTQTTLTSPLGTTTTAKTAVAKLGGY